MVFSFIWEIRRNQQGSTQLSQPHIRVRVIGELEQHGGSKVRLLKTAAESSWEPEGALQLEQKIEDSAKAKSCSVHKGFDEDVEGISGGECNGQTSKQDVHVMLMSVRCLLACSCLVQHVEGRPKAQ
ncbi:unnamed protein product [Musa acuminata subsp. burmannicoides]